MASLSSSLLPVHLCSPMTLSESEKGKIRLKLSAPHGPWRLRAPVIEALVEYWAGTGESVVDIPWDPSGYDVADFQLEWDLICQSADEDKKVLNAVERGLSYYYTQNTNTNSRSPLGNSRCTIVHRVSFL